MSVEEILATPDVAERVDLYRAHHARAVEQIQRCATRGHEAAGTCQIANEDAERVLGELIARITTDD
jgi:hypothetical protein